MIKDSYSGLPLIRSCKDNLEWWINSSHSKKTPKQGYDLLVKIYNRLNKGIENIYQFKRFELFRNMEEQLEALMLQDPNAHAVDMRVIFNLPQNKILNEGYVIKAVPYNIKYNG